MIQSTFNKLTVTYFENFIEEMNLTSKRRFHVWTGEGGKKAIDDAVKKEYLTGQINDLYKQKKISKEDMKQYNSMLSSPDEDNLILLDTILENIK